MKFCPVVPDLPWTSSCFAERKNKNNNNKNNNKKLCLGDLIIIIIIRNGAKTISLQTLFGRLNKEVYQMTVTVNGGALLTYMHARTHAHTHTHYSL